jgi:hypothetical protein
MKSYNQSRFTTPKFATKTDVNRVKPESVLPSYRDETISKASKLEGGTFLRFA